MRGLRQWQERRAESESHGNKIKNAVTINHGNYAGKTALNQKDFKQRIWSSCLRKCTLMPLPVSGLLGFL